MEPMYIGSATNCSPLRKKVSKNPSKPVGRLVLPFEKRTSGVTSPLSVLANHLPWPHSKILRETLAARNLKFVTFSLFFHTFKVNFFEIS